MPKSQTLFCFLCSLIGLALALFYLLTAPSVSRAQAKKGEVSFINDVAPILKKNCFGCHDAVKKKGKFDMTTYESFRKGGRNDDPIEPGNPKASYIYDVLTTKSKRRMPPEEAGKPLPKDQIDVISAWIKQGGKLDKGIAKTANLRRELRSRWQPPSLRTSYGNDPALITALAFTPDNKSLIASGYHELTIWDVKTGKLTKRLHTRAERGHDIELLKDWKIAVAGGRPGQEGDVRIYDLKGKSTMKDGIAVLDGVSDKSVLIAELVQTDDEEFSVDASDDGKKIAAAGCDRLVRVWDVSKGYNSAKLEHTIENHADWVLGVNFSPNGQFLITASRDKSSKIWVMKSKESLVTFPTHGQYVFGAVMSIGNNQGISAGADNQLRSWDANEKSKNLGKQIRAGGGHSNAIFDLAEHRDGKKQILATCSADSSVRIWDAANLRAVRTLTGLKDWVFSVAISPDGKMVAAGGLSGDVHIWQIADGKLVKQFSASPGFVAAAQVKTGKK